MCSFKQNKILIDQVNARVHTCAGLIAKIEGLKFVLLYQPPYSPHFAPSDFISKPKAIGLQRSMSTKQIFAETYMDLPRSFFSVVLKHWKGV